MDDTTDITNLTRVPYIYLRYETQDESKEPIFFRILLYKNGTLFLENVIEELKLGENPIVPIWITIDIMYEPDDKMTSKVILKSETTRLVDYNPLNKSQTTNNTNGL